MLPDWRMPCIAVSRSWPFSALGGGLVLLGAGPGKLPDRPAIQLGPAMEVVTGCPSPPGGEPGMAVWRAALRARS